MLVRDFMTKDPITISPDMTLPDASRLMKEHHFRRLPVVKNQTIVGIITDRDVKQAMPSDASSLSIWEITYLLSKLEVKEIMQSPVWTIDEEATVHDAARMLLEHNIGGLPVTKNKHLTGMITTTDILKAFVRGGP
jgi:acetoin utilization protein AcuB